MMKNSEQNFFNIINKDLNNHRIDKINEFLSDKINLSKWIDRNRMSYSLSSKLKNIKWRGIQWWNK